MQGKFIQLTQLSTFLGWIQQLFLLKSDLTPSWNNAYFDIIKLDNLTGDIFLMNEYIGKNLNLVKATQAELPSPLVKSTYYKISSSIGSATITLPSTSGLAANSYILLSLDTSASFTALNFSATGGTTITYDDNYSIKANSSYDLMIKYDGSKWIISIGIIKLNRFNNYYGDDGFYDR